MVFKKATTEKKSITTTNGLTNNYGKIKYTLIECCCFLNIQLIV